MLKGLWVAIGLRLLGGEREVATHSIPKKSECPPGNLASHIEQMLDGLRCYRRA